MRSSAVSGIAAAASRSRDRIPLEQAIPALRARLDEVQRAIAGGAPPTPPAGFGAVPDAPPSRRERALLVQFAWTVYTVTAGRPPAAKPPEEWPWRLNALVPLSQRRPDLLPALARLVDRVLTAPPMAPLPSVAGFEELLRRAGRLAGDPSAHTPAGGVATADLTDPTAGVTVAIDFHPREPEPVDSVVARLRLLAGVLVSAEPADLPERRRALFRLGWTGWERLWAAPPYRHDTPYVLHVGSTDPLPSLADKRPDVPLGLVALLEDLLDQRPVVLTPSVRDVAARLDAIAIVPEPVAEHARGARGDEHAIADSEVAPLPPHPVRTVAAVAASEAERVLDGLIALGAIRAGPSAAHARSLDERIAVAGLAWTVYRALTGTAPVQADTATSGHYIPLADLRTDVPAPLVAVVDGTLAPAVPGTIPGVAAWLAALRDAETTELTDGGSDASAHLAVDEPAEGEVDDDAPAHARVSAEPQAPRARGRRIRLLPEADPSPPRWPWIASLLALSGLGALTLLR
jgi:hypothetical protein